MTTMIIILITTAMLGFGSVYFLGKDNKVEQTMEKVDDCIIEDELHLPHGSVDIDFSED